MVALVHASTHLLRSRSQFTRLIDTIRTLCDGRLLFFSLCHNAPDLEQSVRQLSSCARETIGCLSSPLPIASDDRFFSCSLAIFERNSCVPFSSLESGEEPTQVGRWHAYDKRQASNGSDHDIFGRQSLKGVNWNELWDAKSSARFIPRELKNVRDARTLLYFSDNSSWELATSFREHLPQASQLGMIASPTPFVTGLPFTLLRNGKVQSSGAVGIALGTAPSPSEAVLSFDGVMRLTRPLVVRRSEGNLIHELGDSTPARVLLKSIQDHGLSNDLSKDVDYYIGIRDTNEVGSDDFPPSLLRIIAGSPSRGSIAVEDVPAPPVGTLIEFYYRPRSSPVRLRANVLQPGLHKSEALIGAVVDTPENMHNFSSLATPEGPQKMSLETYKSSFLVASEHGFILSSCLPGKEVATWPWKCTVPSAFGGLKFRIAS